MTSSERTSRHVAFAVLVAALAAGPPVAYKRTVSSRIGAANEALATTRVHVEAITVIRRDARKTYVRVLERWLRAGEGEDASGAAARTQAESVAVAGVEFTRVKGLSSEEAELAMRLSSALDQWRHEIDEASRSSSGPESLPRLQQAGARIDAAADSIMRLNSEGARAQEQQLQRLQRVDAQIQVVLEMLGLAVVLGLLAWRVGARASRQTEARYRELFERISDGVIVLAGVQGADFVVTDVNEAALHIQHVARSQIVGRLITEVFPGAREYGLLEAISRVRLSGIAEHLSARFCEHERIPGWRESAVYRLPNGEVVVVYRDVTAQKTTEERMRAQTQLMKALLAGIPSPVSYKDVDGRYLGCNPAFEEFLGLSADDIVGRTVGEVWHEPYATTHRDLEVALLRHPGKVQYESQLVDSMGRVRDVVLCKSTFRGADDQIAGVVAVMLDITERKQRERMEMELRQAQKLQAVGQLAAGIAHEINTPVQYVGDSLQFLKDASDTMTTLMRAYRSAVDALAAVPEQRSMVDEIRRNEEAADLDYLMSSIPDCYARCFDGVARIASIVRAMKEFAHPDQREKSPADLNQALRNTLTICANEYKYFAEVEACLGDIPPVVCHLGDVSQVFLNLVVNAAHAIADVVGDTGAKGRIRVSTRSEGASVYVQIADSGSGIPEHLRERIFEPFFTTKPVGKGTGQGLAIARSIIVDKHGGSLTFESKVGEGTTFTIRLPIDGESAVVN